MTASWIGKRIAICGPTGSGKSTVGALLAQSRSLPLIELDALYWLPNWEGKQGDQFRNDLSAALNASPAGWVVAGNYTRVLAGRVITDADTIIWLHLPFHITYWRLFQRTVRRALTKQVLWGTNTESWRQSFFSRESILLYGITSYRSHVKKTQALLNGVTHARVVVARSAGAVSRLVCSARPPVQV